MKQLASLTIGRFRIEKGIGQGGMGIVYRAHDTVLDRPVALKLLSERLSDNEQALLRFHREAETLLRLKHSNIALVYDFGEHEGRPYIAMEWVEGRTLKAILQQEGRLSLARSLHIVTQLASALDYAHQHGVVHRDIKPANILIDETDHATIVDFGVAWWNEAPSLTTTGTIVGTPLYMSPEQLLGQPLDGRSDLYSLAIILYEMLAGHPPFGGQEANTPAVIQQQLYLPPPPLIEQNPAIPEALSHAIEKALSKLPADRFANGAAFVQALHAQAEPAILRVRRKRLILGLLLAGLLALIVGAGIWQLGGRQGDVAPAIIPTSGFTPPPAAAPTTPQEGPTLRPLHEPDGGVWPDVHGDARQFRYQEEAVYPLAAEPRWRYHTQEPLMQPLVAGNGALFLPEGGRIQILDWATGQSAAAPPNLGAAIIAPLALLDDDPFTLFAATEDKQLYALEGYDRSLLWRLGSDALEDVMVQQTAGPDGILYVASIDGRLLGVDNEGEILFTLYLDEGATLVQPPAVTATGVYGVTDQHTMVAADPKSQQIVWQTALPDLPTTPALPLEEHGVVVTGLENGEVQALSVLSGEARWHQALEGDITGLAYNDDHLFAATGSGRLYALNSEDGAVLWQRETHGGRLFPPIVTDEWVLTLSESGEWRIFANDDGGEWQDAGLDLGMNPTQPPVFLGGWLFVQSEDAIWAFGPRPEPAP